MKIFVIVIVGVVIATLAAVATLATTRRAAPVVESQRETRVLTGFSRIEVYRHGGSPPAPGHNRGRNH